MSNLIEAFGHTDKFIQYHIFKKYGSNTNASCPTARAKTASRNITEHWVKFQKSTQNIQRHAIKYGSSLYVKDLKN